MSQSIEEILNDQSDTFKQVVNISMRHLGLSLEQAYDKALKTEERAKKRQSYDSECTSELRFKFKETFLELYSGGKRAVTAKEASTAVAKKFGLEDRDARGIGDLLGRGRNGLYLEPSLKKKGGRNAYILPRSFPVGIKPMNPYQQVTIHRHTWIFC